MSRASVRLLLLALVAAALFVLIRHPGSVNRDQASVPGEVVGRPDFSPDGKRVILGGFDMFIHDAAAQTVARFEPEDPWRASRQRPVRDPRRLAPSPFEGYASPRWSPDGRRVAA